MYVCMHLKKYVFLNKKKKSKKIQEIKPSEKNSKENNINFFKVWFYLQKKNKNFS